MKTLMIQGSPVGMPAVKSGDTCKFGICLGDITPSSNVTVTISTRNGYVTVPSPMTFTSGNFAVPQEVVITAVENSLVEGIKYEVVTLIATGGGYNLKRNIRIPVIDTGLDPKFVRGYPLYQLNITNVTTARNTLIAEIFNGTGLPSNAVPASIINNYTGTMNQTTTSALTGVYSVDKLTFTRTDRSGFVWTNLVYHIKAGVNIKNCCIVHGGHSSESSHLLMLQDLISNGIDVLYCAMPITFNNTTTNPTIGGVGVSGHNDIKTGGLDNNIYNPLELFLFDKIEAINYIKVNSNYLSIFMCGCSGGGWTSLLIAALDSRVQKAVDIRGATPYNFWDTAIDADYEQGPILSAVNLTLGAGTCSDQLVAMYNATNYYDMMILAGSNGREFHSIHHVDDTCCHNTYLYNLFFDRVKRDGQNFNANITLLLLTDIAYAAHGFNVPDRAYCLSQFLKQ